MHMSTFTMKVGVRVAEVVGVGENVFSHISRHANTLSVMSSQQGSQNP